MTWYIILAWVFCSVLSVPLFIWWWTRGLDFTSSEIPGVILAMAFGPIFLLSMVLLSIGAIWESRMPEGKILWPRRE